MEKIRIYRLAMHGLLDDISNELTKPDGLIKSNRLAKLNAEEKELNKLIIKEEGKK